jgi:hypothetical protein
MGTPIYRLCMANNSAGTKLGVASSWVTLVIKTGSIHG